MKPSRKSIFDKSGGKCWYCGLDLPERWHIDHFDPIWRNKNGFSHPERDIEDNKVPACPSCNILKYTLDIEDFRGLIQGFIHSLNNYHNQYKFAKKFGLVEETGKEVVFWFERTISGRKVDRE